MISQFNICYYSNDFITNFSVSEEEEYDDGVCDNSKNSKQAKVHGTDIKYLRNKKK